MTFQILRKKRFEFDPASRSTVILTVWKRDNLLEQLKALSSQSLRPSEIWVYQCGDFVNTKKAIKAFPGIRHIHSGVNLKYFGRFALAQFVQTDFVWILDDDVIPGQNWLQNASQLCQEKKDSLYQATIALPFTTDSGFGIPQKTGMTGTAEIITEDLSLFDRLFSEIRRISH